MILKEEQKDLFTVPKDYALVHCISADVQWVQELLSRKSVVG